MACWGHRPIVTPKKSETDGKRLRNLRAPLCDDVAAHPALNYLVPDPHETTAQDLDYFVWLIRGGGRDILVDTGFNAEEAQLRDPQAHAQSGRCAGALRR